MRTARFTHISSKCYYYILILVSLLCFSANSSYSALNTTEIVYKELSSGVVYKKLSIKNGRYRHFVHVIEADLENPDCSPALLLASERAGSLKKLQEIIRDYDDKNLWEVVGAVNGSFWRAYNNFPIGPTIIDGEVVELNSYKAWTSCMFDEFGMPTIDHVEMGAYIILNDGLNIRIDKVNRRRDSSDVVVYNRYSGNEIPFIFQEKFDIMIDEALMDSIADSEYRDITDLEFDLEEYKQELIKREKANEIEFDLTKVSVIYLDKPVINSNIVCRVLEVGSGSMKIPENGCIISLNDSLKYLAPKVGDVLTLKFQTDKYQDIQFTNMITATPRLVRDGSAKHEAEYEGSRSGRFIRRRLSRSAVGTDFHRTKLFLVSVEPGSRKRGNNGASLSDMAEIMRSNGCQDAMNLDGGGSSLMVIGQENVTRFNNPGASRKISTAISIIKNKSNKMFDFIEE